MISPKEIKSQRHSESGRMERAFIYELVLELVRGVKLAVVKFDLGFLGKLAEFFQFLFAEEQPLATFRSFGELSFELSG